MLAKLKIPTVTTRYINVFRDKEGKLHYSTEEFAIGTEALINMNDAIEDAKFMSKHGWEYIETLVSNNEATDEIERELKDFI